MKYRVCLVKEQGCKSSWYPRNSWYFKNIFWDFLVFQNSENSEDFICWNSSFRASGRTKISKNISGGTPLNPVRALTAPSPNPSCFAPLTSLDRPTPRCDRSRVSGKSSWRREKGMKINGVDESGYCICSECKFKCDGSIPQRCDCHT